MEKPKRRSPPQLFKIFGAFCLVAGVLTVTSGLGNLLSGCFILKRKYRLFSLIVAGLNCLQFPFGTAREIFTFVLLCRDSVRAIYAASSSLPRP